MYRFLGVHFYSPPFFKRSEPGLLSKGSTVQKISKIKIPKTVIYFNLEV